ncbi:MAG: hypothetical protein K5784_03030 [Clostridiales bacterium]|nr:hypothetical protein [Clostridiales bacterium]
MNQQELERFDMNRPPVPTAWYLRPLTYLLSVPDVLLHRAKIRKISAKGLKPPYLLLCNHNAFLDFKVATMATFPHHSNYIVAIDGFIGRENLLRKVGCICKRKFTNDVVLVRQIKRVIQNGDICMIYPEARYSLCGTTAVLPASLGTLCKYVRVPVVTLICHGHHINSPFWNLHQRGVRPTEAELTVQFTADELKDATVDEINARLVSAFQYDEYAWQKARGIRVTYPKRAEGLEKVLYQCPHCKTEYRMASEGSVLFCGACHKRWKYSELGELEAEQGETEFSHIPDWYEWKRANVRSEIESGTYDSGELPVTVRSLPNAKKFILLGEGTLRHSMDGFSVHGIDGDGDAFEMVKPVPSLYSCHIEYEYLGKFGDCVDLNTLEDTWYIYPHDCSFAVTKMALATEELYQKWRRDTGRPCKPGLA